MGVGCFAIIISISVINGFENIVHQKLKGFEGDIRLFQNTYDPKWEKIDGVDFLCCDFQKEKSKEKILKKLSNKADLLVSDMAADTTGNKDLDCIRTNALCAEVIEFSSFVINESGVVIAKLFNGKDFLNVKNLAQNKFRKVNFFKPESSRAYSKETYIHCAGIKTL